MDNEVESLLLEIIHLFADRFGPQAILRGGMVLRVLGSARFTNDLDYLLVPFKSKNDVEQRVVSALNTLPNVEVSHSLNSKCLRCVVKRASLVVQVEVKVDLKCPVKPLSTSALARLHNQTPRLINAMALEVAFAHKMAAWYERRLLRDIYDMYLLLDMGVKPDATTLAGRLVRPTFARNVNPGAEVQDVESLYQFLRSQVEALTAQDLTEELRSILSAEDLLGLDLKIKSCLLRKLV